MPTKRTNYESRIKVHDIPAAGPRSGGEARPFDFPHLYRIRAGDWRISYAVEHNRLAVLVLEVLHPDKPAEDDQEREAVARKMKVKLLDLPEGENQGSLAREPARKSMIKLLNPADAEQDSDRAGPRVRLGAQNGNIGEPAFEEEIIEGKVTPLDSPSE